LERGKPVQKGKGRPHGPRDGNVAHGNTGFGNKRPHKPRQPDPLQTALGFPSSGQAGRGQRRGNGNGNSNGNTSGQWGADRFGTGSGMGQRRRRG